VTLADFGYPVLALWFDCSQDLFGFPIFRLMTVIPETRRANQIEYLRFH
jgi:hypothetical protein